MLPNEWLKRKHLEPFIIPAIVVLVGLSAFALGRLSAIAGGVVEVDSSNEKTR